MLLLTSTFGEQKNETSYPGIVIFQELRCVNFYLVCTELKSVLTVVLVTRSNVIVRCNFNKPLTMETNKQLDFKSRVQRLRALMWVLVIDACGTPSEQHKGDDDVLVESKQECQPRIQCDQEQQQLDALHRTCLNHACLVGFCA